MPWIGLLFVAALVFWLAVNLYKTPADFVSIALEGLTLGLVYGLIALGYSLVYGILELINFAHGDVFMLGSWVMIAVAVDRLGLDESSSGFTVVWGLGLTAIACMAFCGFLNASIERVAYRPLRHAPRLAPLITAIGMSFILQDVGLNRLGPAPVSVPNILPTGVVFEIGDNKYRWSSLIVALSTIPVLILLVWLVQKTRQGKAMRATAQDQEAAAMMGINVNRTISFTFLIAGGARRCCRPALRAVFDQCPVRPGIHARTDRVHGGGPRRDREPPGRGLRRDHHRADPAVQRGSHLACAGFRLDAVDRLRDLDPDPRLPSRGPARRTDAGGRLDG